MQSLLRVACTARTSALLDHCPIAAASIAPVPVNRLGNNFVVGAPVLVQLTLSAKHYVYVAPEAGARFDARMATPARDVKVRRNM